MTKTQKRRTYLAIIVGAGLLTLLWRAVLTPHAYHEYSWALTAGPAILAVYLWPFRRGTTKPARSDASLASRSGWTRKPTSHRRVSVCAAIYSSVGVVSLAGLALAPRADSSTFTWMLLLSAGCLVLRARLVSGPIPTFQGLLRQRRERRTGMAGRVTLLPTLR